MSLRAGETFLSVGFFTDRDKVLLNYLKMRQNEERRSVIACCSMSGRRRPLRKETAEAEAAPHLRPGAINGQSDGFPEEES